MADRVEVLGLDEVLKNLKGLEPELKRKALLGGARKGANEFKKQIKVKAPKKTGNLIRSVRTRAMKKSLMDIVGVMVVFAKTRGTMKKTNIKAYGTAFYWYFLEYGWYAGGRWRKNKDPGEKIKANAGLTRAAFRAKNKRERIFIPGRFFVKRSFDAKKDSVKRKYAESIKKWIDKYRGR